MNFAIKRHEERGDEKILCGDIALWNIAAGYG
jgi:hypothetical protein